MKFHTARDGDDLLVSFECDFCIFSKLYRRLPYEMEGSDTDEFAMACIRRVVLDSFWSRAKSTVSGNTYLLRSTMKLTSGLLGHVNGPYGNPGPLPDFDHCGYLVAMQMVAASMGQGRYSSSYKQWDTICRVKSVYSNHYRSTSNANSATLSMVSNKGTGAQIMTEDPCCSFWFQRFSEGCRKRMGQEWRPNKALSVEIMADVLLMVKQRVMDATTTEIKVKWLMAGGYFCVCYVVSLRSTEGLLCDLAGLLEHFDEDQGYMIIPLLGQVKGEHHSRQHLLPCVERTDSGIAVKVWLKRILAVHALSGRRVGPAFINEDGVQSSTGEMNDLFQELMLELFETKRSLFDIDVKSATDIQEKYNVYRSFRRGSESRAVAQKVSKSDRYIIHRWRNKETAGQNKVGHPIDQLYVDISLVKDAFLRYTKAM